MSSSLQPLMSLFNLLKEAGSTSDVAASSKTELVANGLKTTRIVTSEKAFMLAIHEQYGDFLVFISYLMGCFSESKVVQQEARRIISNYAQVAVLPAEFSQHIQKTAPSAQGPYDQVLSADTNREDNQLSALERPIGTPGSQLS